MGYESCGLPYQRKIHKTKCPIHKNEFTVIQDTDLFQQGSASRPTTDRNYTTNLSHWEHGSGFTTEIRPTAWQLHNKLLSTGL